MSKFARQPDLAMNLSAPSLRSAAAGYGSRSPDDNGNRPPADPVTATGLSRDRFSGGGDE
jgi:hypothetical protein